MKIILRAALCALLLFPPLRSFGLDAVYNFTDFTGTPQKIKSLTIEPIAPLALDNTNIVTGDRRIFVTDTSGSKTVSNILSGYNYRITLAGSYTTTVFTNSFGTNVTGLVNASDYIAISTNLASGLTAYSKAEADARFALIGEGGGGNATNVLQVAAGEGVVVDTNSLVRTVSVDTNTIATQDYVNDTVPSITVSNATHATDSDAISGVGISKVRLNRTLSHSIQTNLSNIFTNQSFPSMAISPDRSTIALAFRGAEIHGITNDCILLTKTHDGGASWSTPVTIVTNGGFDVRNQCLAITSTGRYVLMYQRRSVSNQSVVDMVTIASDDEGATWFELWSDDAIDSPYTTISGAGYGTIYEIDGVLHAPVYATLTSFTVASYDYISSDWGTNWVPHTITANTNGWIEPSILPITAREIFAVTRMSSPRGLYTLNAWWSDSGGTNWDNLGEIETLTKGSNAAPVALSLMQSDSGPQIVMALGDRADGQLKIGMAPVSEVKTNPSALLATAKIVAPINSDGGTFLEGGYPSIVSVADGEYLIGYYYADAAVTNSAEIRFALASVAIPVSGLDIIPGTINSNKFDAATLALFGAGSGSGDVTADGNNAFTGDNTHSGTETFSGTVTLPSESVGTNNAVQAEWNDFIDARITTGTDSPTNFLGAPGSGATGASFNMSALTNASPKIATNNATASDGYVLSKSGDNLKLVPQSAGGSGTGTTNAYWVQATGMVGDGTTDNTAALQALIDAYLDGPNTNESVNVTIFVPPGRYRFSSAPKGFLTNENAMIGIPRKGIYTTAGIPLWSRFELRGNSPFQYGSGTASSGVFPTNGIGGTVFFIDRTNRAAFIKSQGWETNQNLMWNYTSVSFQNITFLKPDDSQMDILYLKMFPSRFVRNCTFARVKDGAGDSMPVAGTAIVSPQLANDDLNGLFDVNITGFYNGFTTTEHDRGDNINVQGCVNGMVIENGIFMTHYDHVYIGNCPTNIIGVAAAKIKIDNLEIERNAPSDWRSNRVDYADNNSVSGEIRWMCLDDINSTLSQKLRVLPGTARGGIVFRSNQYGGRSQTEVTGVTLGYRGDYMTAFSADASGPTYGLFKGRGDSGTGSIVQSGDLLGAYTFGGYDGATYPGIVSSYLGAFVDSSPGSGSVPSRVVLAVGSSGSAPVVQTWRQSGITFNTNTFFAAGATFTNAPTFRMTNAAPTSVTIGTTAPDWWITITNNAGEQGFMPVWKNH